TALDTLVDRLREPGGQPVTAGLAERFNLTDGQTAVLERAAEALAAERDQLRRLDALVAVGQEARVIVSEAELLRQALRHIADGFAPDEVRVGLVVDGQLRFTYGQPAAADGAPTL